MFGGTEKALQELGFTASNDLPFVDLKKGATFRALYIPDSFIIYIWKRETPQSDWVVIYIKPDYPLDDWQIPFDDIKPLVQ